MPPRKRRTTPPPETEPPPVLDDLIAHLGQHRHSIFRFTLTLDLVEAQHGPDLVRALTAKATADGIQDYIQMLDIYPVETRDLIMAFSRDLGRLLGVPEQGRLPDTWTDWETPPNPESTTPSEPTPTRHRDIGRA